MRPIGIVVCALGVLIWSSQRSRAQPVGAVVAQGTIGVGQIYLDEPFPDHSDLGGSVRFFIAHNLAIEPEFLGFQSNVEYLPHEFRYTAGGGLLWFLGAAGRKNRPYVSGGGEVRYGGTANSSMWPYGGVGVQCFSDRRLSFSAEARAPILSLRANIGFRLFKGH